MPHDEAYLRAEKKIEEALKPCVMELDTQFSVLNPQETMAIIMTNDLNWLAEEMRKRS